jgi:hypothetical protein
LHRAACCLQARIPALLRVVCVSSAEGGEWPDQTGSFNGLPSLASPPFSNAFGFSPLDQQTAVGICLDSLNAGHLRTTMSTSSSAILDFDLESAMANAMQIPSFGLGHNNNNQLDHSLIGSGPHHFNNSSSSSTDSFVSNGITGMMLNDRMTNPLPHRPYGNNYLPQTQFEEGLWSTSSASNFSPDDIPHNLLSMPYPSDLRVHPPTDDDPWYTTGQSISPKSLCIQPRPAPTTACSRR